MSAWHPCRARSSVGRQFGLTGRWVAAPNQAAMRRLPAVPPFRGYERQLSSAANATFRPRTDGQLLSKPDNRRAALPINQPDGLREHVGHR